MSDLDFATIPLDEPLPYVQDGYRLFAGEVINALIARINNGGGTIPVPVPISYGGTGQEDAPSALAALGGQPLDADLTAIAALATTGLSVRTGAGTWALRSLTAPAAGMTITNGTGIAGDPTFAFTGNLLALVGLAGTGIAVQTGVGAWAQRTFTGGTGITITDGDGVAGNPTAAINLAANLTWTGIPTFSNGIMVSEDGVAIGAGGATDALIYQPAADQMAVAVGASTFTFTAASLSLNGNAFLTSATALLKANNLSDLASATTALTNLGLSADAKSFVTAANYAAMRTAISLVPGTDVQAYSAVLTTLAGASANGQSLVTAADYSAMRTLLSLRPGTDIQVYSAVLTAFAALAPTNGDFLQYTAGAWANRTAAQATATLSNFVGDSGAGGTKGLVPAPAAGDAAANKFLKADGTWVAPTGSGDVVGPAAATNLAAALFDGTTGKLIKDSKVILTVPVSAATLTLGSGKTVTISNALTFSGTDGSTLAIGAGGTLTTLAFTAPGTGVATALAVNVGTAGAFVVNGGALGTPSGGTLTNCTGYTLANLSGLGANVGTFLATPSSANLLAALTDKTGTGVNVFATSPTLVTPILGVAAATTINKVTITAPATSATLTIPDGLTLNAGPGGTLTALAFTTPAAGVATFLATPSSANLLAAVTDETGTGALVFATSPTFTTKIAAAATTATIGDTTTGWGTLYLKSTGVIDFGNGNYTLTHAAGVLTANGALSIGTGNPLTCGTIELGAAADTTLSRSAAGVLAVEGVVVPTISSTNTLSNKRITPRVTTIVSSATPAVNTDNCDCVTITALAAAITSMTSSLTGTPVNFDKLTYRIKDDGTIRAITWGASFQAMGVALPTTTVAGKVLTVGFIYDTVAAKWGCVASAQEA